MRNSVVIVAPAQNSPLTLAEDEVLLDWELIELELLTESGEVKAVVMNDAATSAKECEVEENRILTARPCQCLKREKILREDK